MPYRTSSPESLDHAQLVIDAARHSKHHRGHQPSRGRAGRCDRRQTVEPGRLGNIMARTRMITLFDLSAAHRALPLGTGNKTERLLGYFTWHADDSPPVNPIGDLFKTQVWALPRHARRSRRHRLEAGQRRLNQGSDRRGRLRHLLPPRRRHPPLDPAGLPGPGDRGARLREAEIGLVRKRLDSTHWKRRLPTVAMLSGTAIGEYYLRPVDY